MVLMSVARYKKAKQVCIIKKRKSMKMFSLQFMDYLLEAKIDPTPGWHKVNYLAIRDLHYSGRSKRVPLEFRVK